MPDTRLQLFTAPTPNGHKISIALEELGLPYDVHPVDLMKGEQKQPDYLRLNPNGRIPTLVDDGFAIFESGAILLHLAEKTGRLLSQTPHARSRAVQWLMFQMGGIGPMMGQANVFFRYFPEKIQPAIDRYQNECKRLFGVLDGRLARSRFLAGDEYSIADIANWAWVRTHNWSGVSLEEWTHLKRWVDEIYTRPAVLRGIDVPYKLKLPEGKDEVARQVAKTGRSIVGR